MFKKKYVYLRIFRDKVTVTNLDTGESISSSPDIKFSSPRSVLGNVGMLLSICPAMVKSLFPLPAWYGWHGLRMLIQQMEDLEGGASQIEERALRDIAEHSGGKHVILRFSSQELSAEGAKKLL
ncbi:MAG: hypothetical protein EOO09_21515 [Chitinophagaceae bacterium]|nr:MAG: hypothetical protein EOO09_21515 [Chitinophagaceae bacterium]